MTNPYDITMNVTAKISETQEELVYSTIIEYLGKQKEFKSLSISKEDLIRAMRLFYGKRLTANEYQQLAARTMSKKLTWKELGKHALHGMVGEIGELHSLYQKKYQGHEFSEEHAKKELGDLLWFIAEYCTAHDWQLEDIMQMNIDKLKARYPDGFEAERSLHRKEGDI